MNSNRFLLSIVIPTKNRYKYLLPMLELLNSYKLENTEIVIEDNSDDNTEYNRFVSSVQLNLTIVYNYNNKQLPVSSNIDNAILHSKGEYVCVIGDDDAVMPQISEFTQWMKDKNIESARQLFEYTYKWPNHSDETNSIVLGASLKFEKYIGPSFLVVDPGVAAEEVASHNFSSLGSCPCVYQGIVSRSALDRVYSIGQTYMPGPSPDMANAMALSFVVKSHCLIASPIIISGGSEYQGGKSEKIKSWVQPLEIIPFISEEDKKKWDKRIPYFWCGATVWPESGIKGLEYVGRDDIIKLCDFDFIQAKALFRGPQYKEHVLDISINRERILLLYYKLQIREKLAKVKRFLVRKGVIRLKNEISFKNVINIASAVNLLENNKWIG